MSQSKPNRGRPRVAKPRTAAERMRAYRARKKSTGLKQNSRWVSVAAQPFSDHRIREVRSLAMHCKIVRKVSRDLALLEIAHANLDRWTERAGAVRPAYLDEWRRILARPWPEVASFITSFDEDAVRLRQSSPFAGVLTEDERQSIYEAFRP